MPLPKKCSHTIFNKNCQYCVPLRDKWYEKANKEGVYEDIEKNEDYLKIYSSDTFRPRHAAMQAGGWQAKAEYYNLAQRFLNEYKFEREVIKAIWAYHCEGISATDIAIQLKSMRFKALGKPNAIKILLKQLKNKMFDLYLSPKKEYHE